MKVTLINPPSPFLLDERVFPAIGVLYVGAVLESKGHEVRMIDLSGMQREKWPSLLKTASEQVDLWGITFTTSQFPYAVSIRDAIKKIDGEAKVIAGGAHSTSDPESCTPYFDSVVAGEGEIAILKIIQNMENMPRIVQTPSIQNLDEIPFPARHLIDMKSYHYTIDGKKATNILTSRGCPYSCAFCCKTWGKQIRFRGPDNVISEVNMLKEKYGFGGIMMFDDEMLINWERDEKIFDRLGKLDLVWRCFTRANFVDEAKAKKMADCGCKEVLIGVESGSDRILKNVNKGTTKEMNKSAIAIFKKYGIRVKAAIIIGLPGESIETIKETDSFLEETQPDDVDFSILMVYPKSDIYERPEKYDVKFEKIDYARDSAFFKTKPGDYKSKISTSRLSAVDILRERDRLEEKFKKW